MSLGHTLLLLAVYVLAAARVTRLINADTILEPLRARVATAAERAKTAADEASAAGQPTRYLTYQKWTVRWVGVYDFLICPWCVGFWVSLAGAAVMVLLVLHWSAWWIVPLAFACSHLIGMGARFVQGD